MFYSVDVQKINVVDRSEPLDFEFAFPFLRFRWLEAIFVAHDCMYVDSTHALNFFSPA